MADSDDDDSEEVWYDMMRQGLARIRPFVLVVAFSVVVGLIFCKNKSQLHGKKGHSVWALCFSTLRRRLLFFYSKWWGFSVVDDMRGSTEVDRKS